MKVLLMYEDHDVDLQPQLPPHEPALIQDLALNVLFNAMAMGDTFVFEVVKKAVLSGFSNSPDTIIYRQNVLKDCLRNASVIREIYAIAVEALESRKKTFFGISSRYPSLILNGSIELLRIFTGRLKQLKHIAVAHGNNFNSEGFRRFFSMLTSELNDEYLTSVQNHLDALKFRNGILISASLGKGNEGTHYLLRQSPEKKQSWIKRLFFRTSDRYTFCLDERDESGARYLSELRDKGINQVADVLARSADHVQSFFAMLRTELAFYVGCLNLHEQLAQKGRLPLSFPLPSPSVECRHSFQGLYDVCLALLSKENIVGNDLSADNKYLVLITGTNQGGKSTFLRSIGQAQLMMQCGMFVPATFFRSSVCDNLFTHHKREEDATMNSGKLDEELARMSDIIDHLTPASMVLLNESFASTNEREGSEIARQIISALLEKRIKVYFVTHLFKFAHDIYEKRIDHTHFLRAERQVDGGRTFKIIEGEPLHTGFGQDLYNKIFRTDN